ncbi:MAG: HAD hydrolase-like protein, partial [Bryobacteraceae bacterium]|nr:HAD hydrolase-like protein [Bryobacteraceae bacterium]
IEEAVAAVTGRRISARDLADAYHTRPWRDALRILLDDPRECDAAEDLCLQYAARSALKRLLVFEGVGMALDALRAEQIDMAAITRHPYALARKQIESTGLDRFFSLVVPPPGGRFDPAAQLAECFRLLETAPAETAVVAPGSFERTAAERAGAIAVAAGWSVEHDPGPGEVAAPRDLLEALLRRWEGRAP